MKNFEVAKRCIATTLSAGLILATVPTVGAMQPVRGTVKVAGEAWVASGAEQWSQLGSTRPFVAGDRIRTGEGGHLLADMGSDGTIGLFENAEVVADGDTIGVERGKVAFHIADGAPLQLAAAGASIAGAGDTHGFIETNGTATSVTAETGALVVNVAGKERRIEAGQRISFETPVQVAGAYGEPEEPTELPAPPPPPPPPAAPEPVVEPAAKKLSASAILGWTALAAVTAVVIAEVVDDDDDDEQATEF
jgi:hypothetical protein